MKIEVVEKPRLPEHSELAEQVLALKNDQALRITDITKKQANTIRQQLYRLASIRSHTVDENGEVVLYLYKRMR